MPSGIIPTSQIAVAMPKNANASSTVRAESRLQIAKSAHRLDHKRMPHVSIRHPTVFQPVYTTPESTRGRA